MASVFRRRKSGPWIIHYFDHTGRRRERSSRTTHRPTASRIAAKLEADSALVREGVRSLADAEALNANAVGILVHVKAYLMHLELGGRSRLTIRDARLALHGWLLPRARIERLSDITLDSVSRALMAFRDEGKAACTVNAKRQAVAAFVRWAWKTGRLAYNPLAHLPKLDQNRDRRYVRRALTDDELVRLFAVGDREGRGLFYRLAFYAGLRRSELARLTWRDVDLQAGTITVRLGKARRTDVLPVHPDLHAVLLAEGDTLPTAKVVAVPVNQTRRDDFKAAQIELLMGGEAADLHSLRVTLATRLARQGAPPQVAQRILRHSTMDMTLRYYTRLGLSDDRAHLAAMATPSSIPSTRGGVRVRRGPRDGARIRADGGSRKRAADSR